MSEQSLTKHAVLLAGGLGTRLRPYTVVLPKPPMPVGGQPILEVIIRQLVNGGFRQVTMAVDRQANRIQAFLDVQVKPHDGYWLDIGRPDDYARAIDDVEARRFSIGKS